MVELLQGDNKVQNLQQNADYGLCLPRKQMWMWGGTLAVLFVITICVPLMHNFTSYPLPGEWPTTPCIVTAHVIKIEKGYVTSFYVNITAPAYNVTFTEHPCRTHPVYPSDACVEDYQLGNHLACVYNPNNVKTVYLSSTIEEKYAGVWIIIVVFIAVLLGMPCFTVLSFVVFGKCNPFTDVNDGVTVHNLSIVPYVFRQSVTWGAQPNERVVEVYKPKFSNVIGYVNNVHVITALLTFAGVLFIGSNTVGMALSHVPLLIVAIVASALFVYLVLPGHIYVVTNHRLLYCQSFGFSIVQFFSYKDISRIWFRPVDDSIASSEYSHKHRRDTYTTVSSTSSMEKEDVVFVGNYKTHIPFRVGSDEIDDFQRTFTQFMSRAQLEAIFGKIPSNFASHACTHCDYENSWKKPTIADLKEKYEEDKAKGTVVKNVGPTISIFFYFFMGNDAPTLARSYPLELEGVIDKNALFETIDELNSLNRERPKMLPQAWPLWFSVVVIIVASLTVIPLMIWVAVYLFVCIPFNKRVQEFVAEENARKYEPVGLKFTGGYGSAFIEILPSPSHDV